MSKVNYSISISVFLTMLILFTACHSTNQQGSENEVAKTYVSLTHPSIQNITEYIQLNGITVLQKKDNIRSTNTGYITSLNLKPGDLVKTGQVYCSIQTKEQQALKNISSLDTSLDKFQRPIKVIANASGILTSINFLQGDYITEGDVLATVSETTSLVIQVNVPYEYNKYVNQGTSCEIILPDGNLIRTKISGALPTVDVVSQSQTYFISMPGFSLPENLNLTVRIPRIQKNQLLCIPTGAVQTDEMQKTFWLMKVINDSVAIKTIVQTGLQNDSMTEIISDKISVSDKIIFQGAFSLADSSIVTYDK